ncbi:MAG TPA: response regulator [Acidiferrobacteraceae bacterium]|nr:response regulator [Acidiferrobacteraceae bacterium]
MTMSSRVDPSTLGWVKAEIENTLKQARLALESYAENISDTTRLRFFITHIHQVTGTLQMVELDGAALLSQEIESLADAILNEKISIKDALFEDITRAILSLSEYLDHLLAGNPDVPLRLIGVLNLLRSAQDAEEISPITLFNPDLSVYPTQGKESVGSDSEGGSLEAIKLRNQFQVGLLGWLKDSTNMSALDAIAEDLSLWRKSARFGSVAQLWWVAQGLVEALRDGGLEAVNQIKKQLGRLDQQMRRLVTDGEAVLVRDPPDALVKELLFHVGGANSNGACVSELRAAFDLNGIIPGQTDDAEKLDPPALDALRSASDALVQEVEKAQDLLSAFFDPDSASDGDLSDLLNHLKMMSSTLDALGARFIKVLLDELSEATRAIMDGRITNMEMASLPMAGALLLVENSVRDLERSPEIWQKQIQGSLQTLRDLIAGRPVLDDGLGRVEGIEISEAELTGSEFNQLLKVVASEVSVNLLKVEEALEILAADHTMLESLDDVPRQLNQIQGAMQMLGQDRAAELINLTRRYIEEARVGALPVDDAMLDALAVSVGSVDAYMAGLEKGRHNLGKLIDKAMEDMDAAMAAKRAIMVNPTAISEGILEDFNAWLDDTADRTVLRNLKQGLRDLCSIAKQKDEPRIEKISTEIVGLLDVVVDDLSNLATDIGPTLRRSIDTLVDISLKQLQADEFNTPAGSDSAWVSARGYRNGGQAADFTDDDVGLEITILEIFIEEAQEVQVLFSENLVLWRDALDDDNILKELRRAFHTLKGSGRLAGAVDIGDLSWIVEDILNKVLKGTVQRTAGLFEFVEQAHKTIKRLVEGYYSGHREFLDITPWKQQVDTLLKNSVITAMLTVGSPDSSGDGPFEGGGESNLVDATGVQVGAVTMGIFVNEAQGHIDVIRRELTAYDAPGASHHVSSELLRATHTLAGSSRSVGLVPVANLCETMESMLAMYLHYMRPFEETGRQLLKQAVESISNLVHDFELGEPVSEGVAADVSDLVRSLNTYIESEPDHEPWYVGSPANIESAAADNKTVTVGSELNVDVDLHNIFLEEAIDLLAQLDEALGRWRKEPDNMDAVSALKRTLHTLKGSARTLGINLVGDLSHHTESLLEMVENGLRVPEPPLIDLLVEVHDSLVRVLDQMQAHQPLFIDGDLDTRVLAAMSQGFDSAVETDDTDSSELLTRSDESFSVAPLQKPGLDQVDISLEPVEELSPVGGQDSQQEPEPQNRIDVSGQPAALDASQPAEELGERVMGTSQTGVVRVNQNLLANLSNYAGEVSIARSRIQLQVGGFKENLKELRGSVSRFREQIRELEIQAESQIMARVEDTESEMEHGFDPLEFDRYTKMQYLSRSLAESLNDLSTIQTGLDGDAGAVELALQQQARLNTELQEGLMKTRLVNFSSQVPRLRHMARQLARELNKNIDMVFSGTEVEVDRNVLDRMLGPLEHIIRNAIDHGIETEVERMTVDKPAQGRVHMACKSEGNDIVFRISDDGRGLDTELIRKQALERGLIDESSTLSDSDLGQFIMMPGFTTRSEVTQVSGRGVGMDVVHNEVRQLGGHVSVDSRAGEGTSVVIYLPLSLSVMQALIVQASDQPFAIPVSSVINIIKVKSSALQATNQDGEPSLEYFGTRYPLMNLRTSLGFSRLAKVNGKVPVLLVRTGDHQVAMEVDNLVGTQEIVVKPLGPQISDVQGIEGATVLGDGSVVLILDLSALWVSKDVVWSISAEASPAKERRYLVMVVDDSLTVRTVTDRHLRKHGMDVVLAKDGVDAVEKLRDTLPDVMLVDIEMPRMDGYELTSRIRSDPDPVASQVPIIIITSRAGAKHKQKAMDLGANVYLTKPYQEETLVAEIEQVLGARTVH